jgi:ABC-type branched-subunit amino acid transport system ATPase component
LPILTLDTVSKRFSQLSAVDAVSLQIEEGEVLGLVGPNGAGKTTLFNIITGFLSASGGRILFHDRNITRAPVYARVRDGIARTFQTPQLFADMSARDNVLIGANAGRMPRTNWLFPFAGRTWRGLIDNADATLDFVQLGAEAHVPAGELSYASQKRLEIARALMTDPQLLLLDEPAAGMIPVEVMALNELIGRIRSQRRTIVVVEHNMRVIMNVSDRIAVMEYGRLISEGTPQEVRRDPNVIRAYLGTAH